MFFIGFSPINCLNNDSSGMKTCHIIVDAGATQVKKTKTGGNGEETTKKGKTQAERRNKKQR